MASKTGKIHVGIGGWKFEPWRETFYPDDLAQKNELEYASRHMTAIEVNSTFYSPQKPATYAKWRSETPDGFVFSLKAPRFVTQVRDAARAKRGMQTFVFGGLAELGDRLGPISWQFAPNRKFDASEFAAFLDVLPAELDGTPLRHVLEVRHESFACDEYVELMRERKLPTVYTDSDEHPSIADITGDFIYARLMRSRSSLTTGYTKPELDRWAKRVNEWAAGKSPDGLSYVSSSPAPARKRDVFVYFIGAAKERNPAAAMALLERLKKR